MDLRAGEIQSRFIQERIDSVEKHFSELCSQFAAYTRKVARLRDKGDELARTLLNFAMKENLNQTLRTATTQFADSISSIQDYRDAEVQRLEAKVVQELAAYGNICKQAKEELKIAFAARSRELTKKHHLEKVRGRHPPNWQQIAQAENELHRATAEATQSTKALEQQVDAFEKKKLHDLKRIYLAFINIELLFHAKTLEIHSKAYNYVAAIDKEEDLEMFRNCLRAPSAPSRLDTVRSTLAESSTTTYQDSASSMNRQVSNYRRHNNLTSTPVTKSKSVPSPGQLQLHDTSRMFNASNIGGGERNAQEIDEEVSDEEDKEAVSIFRKN